MQMSIEGVFTRGKLTKAIDSLMAPKHNVEDRREEDVVALLRESDDSEGVFEIRESAIEEADEPPLVMFSSKMCINSGVHACVGFNDGHPASAQERCFACALCGDMAEAFVRLKEKQENKQPHSFSLANARVQFYLSMDLGYGDEPSFAPIFDNANSVHFGAVPSAEDVDSLPTLDYQESQALITIATHPRCRIGFSGAAFAKLTSKWREIAKSPDHPFVEAIKKGIIELVYDYDCFARKPRDDSLLMNFAGRFGNGRIIDSMMDSDQLKEERFAISQALILQEFFSVNRDWIEDSTVEGKFDEKIFRDSWKDVVAYYDYLVLLRNEHVELAKKTCLEAFKDGKLDEKRLKSIVEKRRGFDLFMHDLVGEPLVKDLNGVFFIKKFKGLIKSEKRVTYASLMLPPSSGKKSKEHPLPPSGIAVASTSSLIERSRKRKASSEDTPSRSRSKKVKEEVKGVTIENVDMDWKEVVFTDRCKYLVEEIMPAEDKTVFEGLCLEMEKLLLKARCNVATKIVVEQAVCAHMDDMEAMSIKLAESNKLVAEMKAREAEMEAEMKDRQGEPQGKNIHDMTKEEITEYLKALN